MDLNIFRIKSYLYLYTTVSKDSWVGIETEGHIKQYFHLAKFNRVLYIASFSPLSHWPDQAVGGRRKSFLTTFLSFFFASYSDYSTYRLYKIVIIIKTISSFLSIAGKGNFVSNTKKTQAQGNAVQKLQRKGGADSWFPASLWKIMKDMTKGLFNIVIIEVNGGLIGWTVTSRLKVEMLMAEGFYRL